MSNFQIAIDGPASAGKSTVAKIIAKDLGFIYCDTGAMYRAITYLGLEHHADLTSESELLNLLAENPIAFSTSAAGQKVFLGTQDVTGEIRTPEVSENVSAVSALPKIRERLVSLQQEIADSQNIVMDGRDIGTHVLPNAQVKIFLVASVAERARRRYEENISKGIPSDLQEIAAAIEKRDYLDSHREVSPLMKATDAIEVDTTGLTIEEVVSQIKTLVQAKK